MQRNEKVRSKRSNRILGEKVKIIQTAKKSRQWVTNEIPQYEVMVCMSVYVCKHVFCFNETVAWWSEEGVKADSATNFYLLNRQRKGKKEGRQRNMRKEIEREKGWGEGDFCLLRGNLSDGYLSS